MKTLVLIVSLFYFGGITQVNPKSERVKGYTKKNGTCCMPFNTLISNEISKHPLP